MQRGRAIDYLLCLNMYVTSILHDVTISRAGGRKWGLGKQTRMILGVPQICLQVELNFFHECEARARGRELWDQLPEPEMRSEGL